LQGRLPLGVSRADFFSWSKTFDYFSRNQRIQTSPRCRSGTNANPHKDLAPLCAAASSALFRFGPNIFPRLSKTLLAGGRVKSLELFGAGTAWQQRTFFRENPKSFFGAAQGESFR
jgi:hypothetical protein